MEMSSLVSGEITTAFANHASPSSGAASGSAATPARISLSVLCRNLSQSAPLRMPAPIEFALFAGRPARRDDAPFVAFFAVDDDGFFAARKADCNPARFAIVEPFIRPAQNNAFEHANGVIEADVMLAYVRGVLRRVPCMSHCIYRLYLR